ncbi:MAG: hypothetical protein PUB76_09580 [Oscillospiraceae bacterium]|nr:hypothetical protein [Oscillospiraceae bacterium]
MKEEYERSKIEIIFFETEDVITTSGVIYDDSDVIPFPEHDF